MKIYTKTGDDGTTSLFDGTRVKKNNPRVHLYGTIDEINDAIGLSVSFIKEQNLIGILHHIQKDLFALGAKLANPQAKKQKDKADFSEDKVTHLENLIDDMESKLEPLQSFILPGGHSSAAAMHMARSICRRAERQLIEFNETTPTDPIYVQYLNRLSDFLFVAARFANHIENQADIPW